MRPEDPEVARAARAGAEARRAMVARIVAAGLVSDRRVTDALAAVPRHLFVPKELAGEAYGDHALPIGSGQTITQAANVGRSAELAAIPPGGRVLEVGTGSGYQAAVLARLAGQVFTLERIPELAERGIEFVVVSGDMIEGTVTATLLNRLNPGAIEERREQAGRLYNVSEFAAEVARAAVEPVPEDRTRLVGDTSSFGS